jgi:hypothetical protein
VGALFDDLTLERDVDPVGEVDDRQPVRDDKEDRRFALQGAGERHTLPLPPEKYWPRSPASVSNPLGSCPERSSSSTSGREPRP